MPSFALSQHRETPTTRVQRSRWCYRFAYARSADSRQASQPGQDYLTVHEDERRLVFAVCDGVSQSFLGHLGAKLLGDAVVAWLWGQEPSPARASAGAMHGNPGARRVDPAPSNGWIHDPADASHGDLDAPRGRSREVATSLLRQIAATAAEQVATVPLPDGLPPVVVDVLEQKRRLGTEAMFVAGRLDADLDEVYLMWLGDTRLRIWGVEGEQTTRLGASFLSQERWSSRRGAVGEPHSYVGSLGALAGVAAYSDGLASLDGEPIPTLSDAQLDTLIAHAGAQPASDDISFLEIWPLATTSTGPAAG